MFGQRPLLVFIAFALGVTPCVYANDTALNDGADGPMPVGGFKGKESVIRMRAEHIEVEFGRKYSKVDAHFVFRSTKPDAPARQLVGFPDDSAAFEEASRRDPTGELGVNDEPPDIEGPIEDMRTYVDGKEVKSELKYGTRQFYESASEYSGNYAYDNRRTFNLDFHRRAKLRQER